MPHTAFLCDICQAAYKTEDAAGHCEKAHCDEASIKVIGYTWEHLEHIPNQVFIEVPRQEPFSGVDQIRYKRDNPQ